MKRRIRQIISILLVICMCAVMVPVQAKAASNIVMNGVDIGYTDGSYFTKNGSTCKDYNNYDVKGNATDRCHKRTGYDCAKTTDPSCNCMRYWPTGNASTCQVDLLSSQCMAFARYCQWKVYGSFATGTSSSYSDLTGTISSSNCTASTLKTKLYGCSPATHIRMPSPHSISVISTTDSGIKYADCNSDGCCKVVVHTKTWSEFATYVQGKGGITYAYSRNGVSSDSSSSATTPTGVVDSITAGTQKVTVRGWAYDEDDLSRSVSIHVYIGSTFIGSEVANTQRPDVDDAFGVGDYHGFEFDCTIPSGLTGSQTVTVYAIDVETINNPELGSITVDIPADTTAPVISDAKIVSIDNTGYTVSCTVTDDTWINSVQFPTWTSPEQDDIIWAEGVKNGDTYTFRVNISEHNYETARYVTHIYAWDHFGNSSCVGLEEISIDTVAPVISNIQIISVDSAGYTIICTVTDDTGVNRVQFPTWTEPAQDDLASDWSTSSAYSGTKNGNTYTYRVDYSDHNNETARYVTDIYAYDNYGNVSGVSLGELSLQYAITYDANGGSGAPSSQTKYYGKDLTISSTIPTRSLYTFLGWSTSSSATSATYQPGGTFTANANTTLYAVWKHVCANGHSYNYTVTSKPTTSSTGVLKGTCSRCSGTTTVTLPKLNTSDYTYKVVTAATCTANGTGRYTWNTTTYGTYNFDVTISNTGHSYTAVVTAPTCTAQGYTTHTCSSCGSSYTDSYTSALGHSYSYKVTSSPTTSSAGSLTGSCSRCSGTITITLPKLNTSDYTYKVVTAATCTANGTGRYTWNTTTYGTYSFDVSISKTGHSYQNGVCIYCGDTDSTVLLGDINGDGNINILDANLAASYYNEVIDLTEEQLQAADVNGDGIVNILDANLIAAYYNEVIDAFPAEG